MSPESIKKARALVEKMKVTRKVKDYSPPQGEYDALYVLGMYCLEHDLDKDILDIFNLFSEEITTLKKAVEILRVSNVFYADKDNWITNQAARPWNNHSVIKGDDDESTLDRLVLKIYSGKTARQAEAKVKELGL